jgi:hypothetical protein
MVPLKIFKFSYEPSKAQYPITAHHWFAPIINEDSHRVIGTVGSWHDKDQPIAAFRSHSFTALQAASHSTGTKLEINFVSTAPS